MPREAKPPAVPIEMPRTEGDLDQIMLAIEKHMGEGHRLGTLLNEGNLSAEEVLDQAGQADSDLYDVLDRIQVERAVQRDAEIEEESE